MDCAPNIEQGVLLSQREHLEVAQHLGCRGLEVELHGKFQIVVDCVEGGGDGQQLIVPGISDERPNTPVQGRPRPARPLQHHIILSKGRACLVLWECI